MAQNTIFSIDADGNLVRMSPGAPEQEIEIQSLIARFPDMIGDDGDLLMICREAAISDNEGSAGRWSLDNLFVTRAAVPVLVEVKRATDTRIRREVVGQMLDYAANAVKHWPAGEMARSFSARCAAEGIDPEPALTDFLGTDETTTEFWDRVDANLKAGKLRLLFVADRIPPELARVVEFLNEQMQAEVLAVELNWFIAANGTRALVPKIIGATQRAAVQKQRSPADSGREWSLEEWIEDSARRYGNTATVSAREFADFATSVGGSLALSGAWVSLTVSADDGRHLKPFGLYVKGNWAINFNAAQRWAGAEPDLYRRTVDAVVASAGRTSTGKLTGWPSLPITRLIDPTTRSQFLGAMTAFVELCRRVPAQSDPAHLGPA